MTVSILLLVVSLSPWSTLQERDDPTISRWEKDIARLESIQQNETTRSGIVFYGSSSIRLWDQIERDMRPWPVIQRGYGGAKLTDVLFYAPRILGPHLGENNPDRCRAVVLFVANDISGDRDADKTPKQVGDTFRKLLDWIRRQDASVPVFWIEVTPTDSRWHVWSEIKQASRQISAATKKCRYTYFIPTAGAFLGDDGNPKSNLFVDDQLHLNSDGYQLWSALIKAQLDHRIGPAVEPKRAEQKSWERQF